MNEQDRQRFEWLRQGPCVPSLYVRDYYGLPWPPEDELRHDFEAWADQRARRPRCREGWISRYEIEAFMQQKAVVPAKWMGARLGMTGASLEELLNRLQDLGMRSQRYLVYPDLIAESLADDIVPSLPGLKFLTFADHNSFCERLHQELRKVLEIDVQPLFCATSDRIQDDPRQYASHFDCITLEPVSGKHQVWLDFRKPLNLSPDRSSKLLYSENRDEFRPFCAGTQEPDDLDGYASFLARVQHA